MQYTLGRLTTFLWVKGEEFGFFDLGSEGSLAELTAGGIEFRVEDSYGLLSSASAEIDIDSFRGKYGEDGKREELSWSLKSGMGY